jgi:hypothetical protein
MKSIIRYFKLTLLRIRFAGRDPWDVDANKRDAEEIDRLTKGQS